MKTYAMSVLLFLFSLLSVCSGNEASNEDMIQKFDVEGDTFYKLSFDVSVPEGSGESKWVVHVVDGNGDLPYDGCHAGDWQRISKENTAYSHAFLTPREGSVLRLEVRYSGEKPELKNVELETITPPDLILNADFSMGEGNHSGWSETYNIDWVEEEGEAALRVNQSGYALTDYFPVVGGAGYNHIPFIRGAKTGAGVSLLAYDHNKRLIGRVARDHKKTPPIEMPQGAAYARVLFCTRGDYATYGTTNLVEFTGLEEVGDPPDTSAVTARQAAEPAAGEIILHPGSDGREERAAKELQYWSAQITGKTMPLLARPSDSENVKIHIGKALAADFEEDLQYLEGTDGYAVRRRGEDIYVFGSHPRGTLFGVYALLERNTDIIWPRPNLELSAVFSETPEIEFTDAAFRSRPAFESRQISNRYSWGDGHVFQDWLARNGLNAPHSMHMGNDYLSWKRGAQLGYSGSYISWLASAKEGVGPEDLDDEYYPLVDGERRINRWRQPCYTYPKTVETMVEAFRRRLRTLPGDEKEVEYLHATIADNWTVCACDDCMEPIELDDGSYLEPESSSSQRDPLFFSTRNFKMLNQVAERLVKDYPDLQIQTHAYIFAAEPPKVDIHPAIIPEYAAYPTQNVRYPIMSGQGRDISIYDREIWKRRFREWSEKVPEGLGFFGYYYTDGFNALADTAAADYRDLHDFGGVQVHTEGFPVDQEELSLWDTDAMEKWVIARLMWDPRQDPGNLREQYITRVYREAAPEMRRFYKLIHESWHGAPDDVFVTCHSGARILFETFIVEPGIEDQLRNLLVSAEQAASHPVTEEMISRKIQQFDEYAATLGRHSVPYVPESSHDWNDAASPHWEKAVVFEDFKMVDDWRTFEEAMAENQTRVAVMHDRSHIYFRVTAEDEKLEDVVIPPESGEQIFPNGDRVEFVLRIGEKNTFYIAVGPDGSYYSLPALGGNFRAESVMKDNRWVAMIAVPFDELEWDTGDPAIGARMGRVYRLKGEERRESSLSGASIYNRYDSFWTNLIFE